jgi:hypothetical protein
MAIKIKGDEIEFQNVNGSAINSLAHEDGTIKYVLYKSTVLPYKQIIN